MGSLKQSTTYTGRGENISVGAFAEVVAGSDIAIEVFAKEGLKFPLPKLRGLSVSRHRKFRSWMSPQGGSLPEDGSRHVEDSCHEINRKAHCGCRGG
jgi:hypothetical protein